METSSDQVHWQLAVDRTGNTAAGTRLDDFASGTVSALYMRLTVTGVRGSNST